MLLLKNKKCAEPKKRGIDLNNISRLFIIRDQATFFIRFYFLLFLGINRPLESILNLQRPPHFPQVEPPV